MKDVTLNWHANVQNLDAPDHPHAPGPGLGGRGFRGNGYLQP